MEEQAGDKDSERIGGGGNCEQSEYAYDYRQRSDRVSESDVDEGEEQMKKEGEDKEWQSLMQVPCQTLCEWQKN